MSAGASPSNSPLQGCLAGITGRGDQKALFRAGGDCWSYEEVVAAIRSGSELKFKGRIGVLVNDRLLSGLVSCAVMNGASCVPLDPKLTISELQDRISHLGIHTIVVDSDDRAELAGVSVVKISLKGHQLVWSGEVGTGEESEAALILMTSGSTGLPKLVPLTHGHLGHSAKSVADSMDLGAEDRVINLLPMVHIGGLLDLFLVPLMTGGSVIFAEPGETASIMELLERLKPTWLQGAPAILQSLHRFSGGEAPPHQLRKIRSVSAPLSDDLYEEIKEMFGVPVIEMYGMSETGGVITSNPLESGAQKIGSVGRAVNCEVEIRNEGEVWVRSRSLFSGYSEPEQNEGLWDGDWFFTGDLGRLDEDGYLFLKGRAREVINRGGQKVSPAEIDEIVGSWNEVKEAASFGFFHPTLGEEVGLAMVLGDGESLSDSEVRERLSGCLADYKLPKRFLRLKEMPRNQGGKLQRFKLAEILPDEGSRKDGELSDLEKRILPLWCAALGVKDAGPNEDFFEQGGDSLSATSFLISVEKRFKISLLGFIFYEGSTIRGVAGAVEERLGKGTGQAVREPDFPPRVKKRLVRFLASWPGVPPFEGSYARVDRDADPSLPILFWACNSTRQREGIKDAIGGHVQIVSLRSLRLVQHKLLRDDKRTTLVYADEVERIQPEGPLLLGGYCEGGRVMTMVGREMIRRGRTVELLALHDDILEEPIDAHVALIFSRGWKHFPPARYPDIEAGWHKLFKGRYGFMIKEGRHGVYYEGKIIEPLGRFLKAQLEAARESKPESVEIQSPECSVELRSKLPLILKKGEKYPLTIRVKNLGSKTLVPGGGSSLYARWVDLNRDEKPMEGLHSRFDGELPPGESQDLELTVHSRKGGRLYQLQIGVLEEGFGWSQKVSKNALRLWRLIR